MNKCPTCNREIWKKDPLSMVGYVIGVCLAIGVVLMAIGGCVYAAKFVIGAVLS